MPVTLIETLFFFSWDYCTVVDMEVGEEEEEEEEVVKQERRDVRVVLNGTRNERSSCEEEGVEGTARLNCCA